MNTLIMFVALILAFVAMWLGFGWFGTSSDQWAGWISASFFAFVLAHLVDFGLEHFNARRG